MRPTSLWWSTDRSLPISLCIEVLLQRKELPDFIPQSQWKKKYWMNPIPVGSPLLFFKRVDELWGVVDGRAFKKTMGNSKPQIQELARCLILGEDPNGSQRLAWKCGLSRKDGAQWNGENRIQHGVQTLCVPGQAMRSRHKPAKFQTVLNRIFYDCLNGLAMMDIEDFQNLVMAKRVIRDICIQHYRELKEMSCTCLQGNLKFRTWHCFSWHAHLQKCIEVN